jgi:DNA-binding response OmpR family regulator
MRPFCTPKLTSKNLQMAAQTELKHDKKTEHIPVFMLTAKGMASDIDRAFELGADDYITKPFDPRMLGEVIKKKLKEPRAK